ncbi:MAG: hypothetical protein WA021_01820 [Minisyncoccia bacterium]
MTRHIGLATAVALAADFRHGYTGVPGTRDSQVGIGAHMMARATDGDGGTVIDKAKMARSPGGGGSIHGAIAAMQRGHDSGGSGLPGT